MKTKITDLAYERTEQRLYEEVKGMSFEQREKYLSRVASQIDYMLNNPDNNNLLEDKLHEDSNGRSDQ